MIQLIAFKNLKDVYVYKSKNAFIETFLKCIFINL